MMLLSVLLNKHVLGYIYRLYFVIFFLVALLNAHYDLNWLWQKINVHNIQVYVLYTHTFSLPQTAPFYWGRIGARTRGVLTAPGTTHRGVYLRHGVDTSALACTRPGIGQIHLYFTVAGFSYFIIVILIRLTFTPFGLKPFLAMKCCHSFCNLFLFSVKYSNIGDHF